MSDVPRAASSGRVVEIIRHHILTGTLLPDTPIRQDGLAAELGISKIPVREALIRLQEDGLIYAIANRGFFVSPLSAAQAFEVYDLRLTIEPKAAAQGSVSATEEDREVAILALAALNRATSRKADDVGPLHRAFHNALVMPAGRYLTGQFVERLHIVSERYVRQHLVASGRIERANGEHAGILDAWRAQDAALVTRLVSEHIQAVRDDLKREFETIAAPALPQRGQSVSNGEIIHQQGG